MCKLLYSCTVKKKKNCSIYTISIHTIFYTISPFSFIFIFYLRYPLLCLLPEVCGPGWRCLLNLSIQFLPQQLDWVSVRWLRRAIHYRQCCFLLFRLLLASVKVCLGSRTNHFLKKLWSKVTKRQCTLEIHTQKHTHTNTQTHANTLVYLDHD